MKLLAPRVLSDSKYADNRDDPLNDATFVVNDVRVPIDDATFVIT